MAEVAVESASPDDVLALLRRRNADEAGVRLALECVQSGLAWVARDQGDAIGLSLARAAEDERYVGDVYVEPSFRGQGIGARLLDAALADAGDCARRVVVDPRDPAAYALALRRRFAIGETLLRVAGALPREDALLSMAAGDYRFAVGPVDPLAHGYALNAIDREVRGTARAGDHERFAREATGLAFFLDAEFVAYAYVWPDGRIGPFAAVSAAYLVQILAYALATLQRTHGASWCTLLIPGTNVRVARAALRAGLRIEQTVVLAGDAAGADFSRYAGYHQLSF